MRRRTSFPSRVEARKVAATPRAWSASTWSFISATSGEITTVVPGSSTAGQLVGEALAARPWAPPAGAGRPRAASRSPRAGRGGRSRTPGASDRRRGRSRCWRRPSRRAILSCGRHRQVRPGAVAGQTNRLDTPSGRTIITSLMMPKAKGPTSSAAAARPGRRPRGRARAPLDRGRRAASGRPPAARAGPGGRDRRQPPLAALRPAEAGRHGRRGPAPGRGHLRGRRPSAARERLAALPGGAARVHARRDVRGAPRARGRLLRPRRPCGPRPSSWR